MDLLTNSLHSLGLEVVPSEANFVMIVLSDEEEARSFVQKLLEQGIIIRPLKAFGLRLRAGRPRKLPQKGAREAKEEAGRRWKYVESGDRSAAGLGVGFV